MCEPGSLDYATRARDTHVGKRGGAALGLTSLARREGVALAGGFIEEDGGSGGGVERFDAGGHRNAEARVGAAFDFFWEAGAFVADQQGDCVAPVDFPRSERRRLAGLRFAAGGGESADSGDAKLREEDGQSHSCENRQMQSSSR